LRHPAITIDTPPTTGVKRDYSAALLDRPIGEHLDSIANLDRGPDWGCYATADPALTTVRVHVALWFPERRSLEAGGFQSTPFLLEWREGEGGNVTAMTWPDQDEAFSVAWAVSSAEPPAQIIASDQSPALTTSAFTDTIRWETVVGPLDGVTKKATAFEYAYAKVQQGLKPSGIAEVTVDEGRMPHGTYTVGDRVRIVFRNRWEGYDFPAARIVSRTLAGGGGQQSVARLSVDVGDTRYPPATGVVGRQLASNLGGES
jgi:hypothetical protein